VALSITWESSSLFNGENTVKKKKKKGSQTHLNKDTSRKNGFNSKRAGAVELWLASLPIRVQADTRTSGLADSSNTKMRCSAIALTIACALSDHWAI
jgi:hypothetical protein